MSLLTEQKLERRLMDKEADVQGLLDDLDRADERNAMLRRELAHAAMYAGEWGRAPIELLERWNAAANGRALSGDSGDGVE